MSAQELFELEKKILDMQDIQEQLDKSWEMDHAEHVETLRRVDFLQHIVFWTNALVVCLVAERLCVYIY